jgi:hypothetical protein
LWRTGLVELVVDLLQGLFRELKRGRLHLALGVGSVLAKRLVIRNDLTPAVAAINYVVNRARRRSMALAIWVP